LRLFSLRTSRIEFYLFAATFFRVKRLSTFKLLRNRGMRTIREKVESRFARKMSLSGKPPLDEPFGRLDVFEIFEYNV